MEAEESNLVVVDNCQSLESPRGLVGVGKTNQEVNQMNLCGEDESGAVDPSHTPQNRLTMRDSLLKVTFKLRY